MGLRAELARVTRAARDGNATREELTGSTITLTSLGALGGMSATPVINQPEVAIIGPNKLMDRPVVIDGQIVVRNDDESVVVVRPPHRRRLRCSALRAEPEAPDRAAGVAVHRTAVTTAPGATLQARGPR